MKVGGVADQIWSLMVVWWWWRVGTQWVLIRGCAHGEDKDVDMFLMTLIHQRCENRVGIVRKPLLNTKKDSVKIKRR